MQKTKPNKNNSLIAKSSRMSSAGWMLGTLKHWMDKKVSDQLKPLELSLNQFIILMILFEEDGQTQVEIGKKGMLPGYATTRVIDQLEKSGYVERQRHETSRKSNRVFLTSKGHEVAPTLYNCSKSANDQIFSLLSKEEEKELKRLLSLLIKAQASGNT